MAGFDDEACSPFTPIAEPPPVEGLEVSSLASEGEKPTLKITKDEDYFMESVFIIFQVERCLFRVPSHLFAKESHVFGGMFHLPQPHPHDHGEAEGSSEANPIILPDEYTKSDFRSLLKALYPLSFTLHLTLAKEEWFSVLKLSTKWYFLNLRKTAVSELEQPGMSDANWLSSFERIAYGRKYRISLWCISGLVDLVMRDTSINDEEALDIDSDYPTTAYRLFRARELRFRGFLTSRPAAVREIEGLFKDELAEMRSDEEAYAIKEAEIKFEKPEPARFMEKKLEKDMEDENEGQPSSIFQGRSFGQPQFGFGGNSYSVQSSSPKVPGKHTKGSGKKW